MISNFLEGLTCFLLELRLIKLLITQHTREAGDSYLPGELDMEFTQKCSFFFFAHFVEKCLEPGENLFSNFFSVCVSGFRYQR